MVEAMRRRRSDVGLAVRAQSRGGKKCEEVFGMVAPRMLYFV
jgi:hypothetical protein